MKPKIAIIKTSLKTSLEIYGDIVKKLQAEEDFQAIVVKVTGYYGEKCRYMLCAKISAKKWFDQMEIILRNKRNPLNMRTAYVENGYVVFETLLVDPNSNDLTRIEERLRHQLSALVEFIE